MYYGIREAERFQVASETDTQHFGEFVLRWKGVEQRIGTLAHLVTREAGCPANRLNGSLDAYIAHCNVDCGKGRFDHAGGRNRRVDGKRVPAGTVAGAQTQQVCQGL